MKKQNKIYLLIGFVVLILIGLVLVFLGDNGKDDKDIVKVGVVLPFTGAGSYSAVETRRGLELCANDNLEFIFDDSASTPVGGISAYKKINEIDKPDINIIGLSGPISAIAPVAKENNDFVIATATSLPNLAKEYGENFFRFFAPGDEEAKLIANFIIKNDNPSRVGILYLNGEFGEIYKTSAEKVFLENNISVIKETFMISDSEFRTQLLKLKEEGVDSIFIAGYEKQTFEILREIKELNINVNVYSEWVIADPGLQKDHEDVLEGVYYTIPEFYFVSSEKSENFAEHYNNKYNAEASIYAAIGCDISSMINSLSNKTPEELRKLNNFEAITGIITQDEYGEFSLPLKIVKFSGGVMVDQSL